MLRCLGHRLAIFLKVRIVVEAQERSDTLWQCVTWHNKNLFFCQAHNLLCAENDVAVVWQNDNFVGRGSFDSRQKFFNTWIHRLSTGYNDIDTQFSVDMFKASTRNNSNGGDLECLFMCVFGMFGFACGGIGEALRLQVLNIDIHQATKTDTIIENLSWCCCVRMHLEQLFIACYDS